MARLPKGMPKVLYVKLEEPEYNDCAAYLNCSGNPEELAELQAEVKVGVYRFEKAVVLRNATTVDAK